VEDDEQGLEMLTYAEDQDIELIFTIGSSTAAFAHNNYQGGDIPVVTMLAKDPVLLGQMPDYESGSGTNIAYTSVSLPVELQVTYFQRLLPQLEKIVVLYEENNASTVKTQVEPLGEYAAQKAIHIIHVPIRDETQAVAELTSKLPPALEQAKIGDPDLEQSIILVTSSRSIFEAFDTVNELAGDFPVVSLSTDLVREGQSSALLSIGVSFGSNTSLATLYGTRILIDGEDPGGLPVGVILPPDIAISFAKAREIGLQVPFNFFESATIVYGPDGELVREMGQ
jgi:putative ABC transport system substrate-binding protein